MTDPPAPGVPEIRALSAAFAELPALAGRSFLGDWFVVDESKLPLFDEASYVSENPYPLDPNGYPEGMVEGFHLLALLDHLVNPVLRISGSCIGWNYGLDRVRFVSPVRAGQKIRVRGTVGAVRPKGSGFVLLCRCTVEVEGQGRPGMVADWWTYWRPGPALAAGTAPAQTAGAADSRATGREPGDE